MKGLPPEQREALHIARYALTRVVDVHVMPVGDRLPDSLHKSVLSCLDELDEALPVGDLGEKPVTLTRAVMDDVERLR